MRLDRIDSNSFEDSGRPGPGDHVALTMREARMAFHSRSATTARKLWMRTTRAPGMALMDDSSTERRVAPSAGGWMTRACSMLGSTRSWRYLWRPVILAGRSGRGSDWPMKRKRLGDLRGALASIFRPKV